MNYKVTARPLHRQTPRFPTRGKSLGTNKTPSTWLPMVQDGFVPFLRILYHGSHGSYRQTEMNKVGGSVSLLVCKYEPRDEAPKCEGKKR